MKISAFKVENYRSLKRINLEKLGNLNILLGKNSGGKSNILEAMNLFFAEFEPTKGTTPGLNEYFWYREPGNKPIVFEVTIDLSAEDVALLPPDDSALLTNAIGKSLPATLKITRSLLDVQGVWKTNSISWGTNVLVKDDVPQPSPSIKLDPSTLDKLLKIISLMIKNKFRLLTTSRDAKIADRFRITILDYNAQDRLWDLQESTSVRDEEKYTDFESTFSSLTSLRLDSAQGKLMVKKGNKRFPLGLEGGGIQGTTNLLFAVMIETANQGVVAIEEPENHAHPELQRRVCKELQKLAQSRQIFIVTHSPIFVNTVQDSASWLVTLVDGQTEVSQVDDFERALREIGARPSDVLFSNKVVLVDGQSDKIALESFASKFGINLSEVALIPIKGNGTNTRSLDVLVPIANKVVPVYLILDADASTEAAQLLEKKIVRKEQVHVWRAGSIASYYPLDTLRGALTAINNRYSLNLNVNKLVQEVQKGKLRPEKIDIGDRLKQLDSSWAVVLASEVARELANTRQELSSEVRDVLLAASAPTTQSL